jgi:hypothetical protein
MSEKNEVANVSTSGEPSAQAIICLVVAVSCVAFGFLGALGVNTTPLVTMLSNYWTSIVAVMLAGGVIGVGMRYAFAYTFLLGLLASNLTFAYYLSFAESGFHVSPYFTFAMIVGEVAVALCAALHFSVSESKFVEFCASYVHVSVALTIVTAVALFFQDMCRFEEARGRASSQYMSEVKSLSPGDLENKQITIDGLLFDCGQQLRDSCAAAKSR